MAERRKSKINRRVSRISQSPPSQQSTEPIVAEPRDPTLSTVRQQAKATVGQPPDLVAQTGYYRCDATVREYESPQLCRLKPGGTMTNDAETTDCLDELPPLHQLAQAALAEPPVPAQGTTWVPAEVTVGQSPDLVVQTDYDKCDTTLTEYEGGVSPQLRSLKSGGTLTDDAESTESLDLFLSFDVYGDWLLDRFLEQL